jgi:hypothetical protein
MKTGLSPQGQIPRLSVVDSNPMTPQDDEVILSVRYTIGGGYAGLSTLVVVWFCYVSYLLVLWEDYLRAAIAVPGCLILLGGSVSALFFKNLLFYRDRLVKVWHLFGQRTIPYSRAKMCVNPPWLRGILFPYGKPLLVPYREPFRVRETDTTGRVRMIQTSIGFGSIFVSPDTNDKVEAIMSYLVGVEDKSKLYEKSRIFTKSTLPKDILSQDQDKIIGSVG